MAMWLGKDFTFYVTFISLFDFDFFFISFYAVLIQPFGCSATVSFD